MTPAAVDGMVSVVSGDGLKNGWNGSVHWRKAARNQNFPPQSLPGGQTNPPEPLLQVIFFGNKIQIDLLRHAVGSRFSVIEEDRLVHKRIVCGPRRPLTGPMVSPDGVIKLISKISV